MATLYIAEYTDFPFLNAQPGVLVKEPPVAEQTVSIGGSSTQSSAFNGATNVIRLHTDAICSVLVGSNPTATAAKKRLAANQTEYFVVVPGHKIAVITNT